MKNTLLFPALLVSSAISAQFYYNDILDARSLEERMKNYVDLKVKTISAAGYDPRGAKTTDFTEWQEITGSTRTLKVTTRNGQDLSRQFYRFDENFRLISITDSARNIKSTTVYSYDNTGKITLIRTNTSDSLQDFSETVEHHYTYNEAGKPSTLWRILNAKDSSEYRFTTDEHGNIADEQLYRRGVGLEPIYYYYDDKNRLTDIVRYNKKARKLLPSQMFEYDENGRVIQKMTILSTNTPDYLIWRYLYNEKGLKTKEALFNKLKELTGRIEYSYTFE